MTVRQLQALPWARIKGAEPLDFDLAKLEATYPAESTSAYR